MLKWRDFPFSFLFLFSFFSCCFFFGLWNISIKYTLYRETRKKNRGKKRKKFSFSLSLGLG